MCDGVRTLGEVEGCTIRLHCVLDGKHFAHLAVFNKKGYAWKTNGWQIVSTYSGWSAVLEKLGLK